MSVGSGKDTLEQGTEVSTYDFESLKILSNPDWNKGLTQAESDAILFEAFARDEEKCGGYGNLRDNLERPGWQQLYDESWKWNEAAQVDGKRWFAMLHAAGYRPPNSCEETKNAWMGILPRIGDEGDTKGGRRYAH